MAELFSYQRPTSGPLGGGIITISGTNARCGKTIAADGQEKGDPDAGPSTYRSKCRGVDSDPDYSVDV
jgi:hypothetical protein